MLLPNTSFKMNYDLEKVIQKDVLIILHIYILVSIFSELISDLFYNISASFIDLSSSSSDDENIPILASIHTIETIYYLIP